MQKGDHLFLVDGSAYIFRAYHALPPLSRKSDGLPVGAVAGFCNMLWKLVEEARETEVGVAPTHFAVIFDHSSTTFRNELYDAYKANRAAPPEDLRPQFSLIRDAVRAFDLPCVERQGFEADDLIATYTRLAVEAGGDVTIVSSDKDLMQLVGPGVTLYDQMKDKRLGAQEVFEKFGVYPEKMIDLQALVGDSSDNVPGVPGIGPKTAAGLLDQFGTLEALLERTSEIKQQKRREVIEANAEQARLSKRLVTLDQNVPLADGEGLDDLFIHEPDGEKLVAFLKAMEFTTLTRRVSAKLGTDIADVAPAKVAVEAAPRGPDLDASWTDASGPRVGNLELSPAAHAQARLAEAAAQTVDRTAYETVRDEARLAHWIRRAYEEGAVAFDTETTALDAMRAEIVGLSVAVAPNEAAYVPIGHVGEGHGDLLGHGQDESVGPQIPLGRVLDLLKPLLEDPAILKIAQNAKYDYLVMRRHGVEIAPLDDTMLISYVLDASSSLDGHGMDELSERFLGHKPISYKELCGSGRAMKPIASVPIERVTEYAAEDADVTLRLHRALKPRLVAEGLLHVYERLERPLVPVVARMEERGIRVDRQILSRLSGRFAQKAAGLEADIHILAGEPFNIGSPKQLGDVLFGKLGLPGGKKTRTGQWATDARLLEDLAAQGHELPRRIVDWRQITRLKNNYADALPTFMDEQDRIHTSYSLASTTTGRLSSSEPNLQNIPARTEEGREIRTAFVPASGYQLVSADYSQIELRLLAHMSQIPSLVTAFREGQDIHAATASEMFGVPVEGMPSDIRRRAKTINFGIIYGISAFGLAAQLTIPQAEAGAYIKRYFERFPGIRDYMDRVKQGAKERGYVETLFGRRAHYPDIKASNPQVRAFNERAAVNAPIQGTAADIIRRAMIRMEGALAKERLGARMLLQVHDELVFEVPDDEVDATIPLIRHVMETAAEPVLELSVPLVVDARAAGNWDEAH
ncbi:DNA polymerase I [Aureimonas jatrophae]|uniref:DNA polymerase I n=1 Tax=Aureimonas jatrophae TaxID=1166073 RepID=A0A1H0IPQ9_9HYPH|nr:DNA polymerase I [Aureimonas jatrophae]MBB3952290.1 DNA polymerase-1 [Aureimonas jatrophae]SDO33376.1 DNA polymerase I [Aureimonas jatrophae]